MPNHVELPNFVTARAAERAYGRAMEMLKTRDHDMATIGMRAARDRNPRIMAALDQVAEHVVKIGEEQFGRTRRTTFDRGDLPRVVEPTEAALWRQAYEWADKGEPLEQFMWIYAAAAEVAGLRP